MENKDKKKIDFDFWYDISSKKIYENSFNKSNITKEEYFERKLNEKLTLRKEKLFCNFMKKRKEALHNNNTNTEDNKYKINIKEIEASLSKEIINNFESSQDKDKILESFLLSKQNNLIQYAIVQLKLMSNTITTIPSHSLIQAAIKVFSDDYINTDTKIKNQSELFTVFINWSAILDSFNDYLYEDYFLAVVNNILISDKYDISMRIDSLWFINNLIKNKHFLLYINKRINLSSAIDSLVNSIVPEELYPTILYSMVNIVTLCDEEQSLDFISTINKLISLYISSYSKYWLVCPSKKSNNVNDDDLRINYKIIKCLLILFNAFVRKNDEYSKILCANTAIGNKLYDLLLNFEPYDSLCQSDDNIVISNTITLDTNKAKIKYNLFCTMKIFNLTTSLLSNMISTITEKEFDSFIEQNDLIIVYTSFFEKCFLCQLLLSPQTLRSISILFSNYVSERQKYANLFVLSSIPTYLYECTKKVNDDIFKNEYMTILYNCFLHNDKKINEHILYELHFIDILCNWFKEAKNSTLIALLLDFFNIIFQFLENVDKLKEKQKIKKKIEEQGILELLEKITHDDNKEISQLAEHLLCYWDIEDVVKISYDPNHDDEEYNDII